MEPSSARSDIAQQLQTLRAGIGEANAEHYRHWALYLQVLRDGLSQAVNKACFHLAVELYPQRYRAIPEASRQILHRRTGLLVHRCCSLLTVEQLLALAAQQRRRRQRRARREQHRWLAAMEEASPATAVEQPAPGFEPQPAPDPAGSVHLGLGLPINLELFAPPHRQGGSERSGPVDSPDQDATGSEAAELIEAFASMLDQASALDPGVTSDEPSSQSAGLLPTDPLRLLQWFDDLDAALAKRLLNLSHALNVELVRLGLSRTLLPMPLLQAIATGQLETQSAPPNLVRAPVPIEHLPEGFGRTAVAVLLRPMDLESEQPPLRTCRSRLRQARQDVRRMAQTHHRLERRLQALEAEQLWLHDHATAMEASQPHHP